MIKIQIALVCGVVAAGIGLSLLLLPGDMELALINLKGKNFGDARASYEAQLQEKGPIMGVVVPLVQIYLHYGDIDKAIDAMERFVAENPKDIEARKRLGLYYDYANRRQDYVRNLQEINRLSPDESSLRELAELYDAHGRHKDHLAILEILVDRHPSDPGEFLHLARLQAASGRLDKADAALERLEKAFPAALSPEAAELRVSLLIDTDKRKAALPWARAYASKDKTPKNAMRLAAIFTAKGAHDDALALLDGFSPNPHELPQLFAMILQIEMAQGRLQSALAKLQAVFPTRRLDVGGRELLIELALRADDQATALEVALADNPAALKKELIVELATAGIESGNLRLVNDLMAKLDPSTFDAPVLQARLALAKGDEAAALKWAAAAERQPDVALDRRLALATVYRRLGRDHGALTVLAALADDDPNALRKGLMVELATAGLESGNLYLVNDLMARLGSGMFDEPVLRARLALAKGDQAAALKWAAAAERQPDLAPEKRLMLAAVYRQLGRDHAALKVLAALAHDDKSPIGRSPNWPPCLCGWIVPPRAIARSWPCVNDEAPRLRISVGRCSPPRRADRKKLCCSSAPWWRNTETIRISIQAISRRLWRR